MSTTETQYGNVTSRGNGGVKSWVLSANAAQTYDWAHRSGASWPCSELSGVEGWIIIDHAGDLTDVCPEWADVPADELRAWQTDVLAIKRRVR